LYSRPRWHELRKEFKQQAAAIADLLTNPTYRKYPIYPKAFNKQGEVTPKSIRKFDEIKYYDYINQYIGGIDAAGREFLTPPEVYAPIYRHFKQSIGTSGKVLKRDYPYIEPEQLEEIDFKYTYHVGEDFRDILGGLRAIFEAVLFLDLKNGNRIGHGLALGIDPKEFLNNRNYEIKLTKMEALDNAIFAYYMIERYNIDLSENKNHIKEIIHGLSKDIYGDVINIPFTIDDLIDAWFLRRNCPNEMIFCQDLFGRELFGDEDFNNTYQLKKILYQKKNLYYLIPNLNYIKSALPDFFVNEDKNFSIHTRYDHLKNNPIAYELYWLYQSNPTVIFRGATNYESNFVFDWKLYEYLQDVMMEHIIASRGIIIESTLSSNILIGGFKKYTHHPIFRFKPVDNNIFPNQFKIRTKKLQVVLGTDNPAIQNTTFIKELYHLKNACNDLGFTDNEAYQYILDIIEEGNRAFL